MNAIGVGLFLVATAAVGGETGIGWQTIQQEIHWSVCAARDEQSAQAECGRVALPLRHDDPTGPTIEVALKRIAPTGTPRRQLWFLDGGPGDQATESIDRLVKMLPDSNLVVYAFDHRGVGGTALLECPEQQAADSPEGHEIATEEWDACISYLRETRSDLDALSATETARDLAQLVELQRESGMPVFVMGVSYGTFLAQRYLQLYPDQVDGVILDGIVPPDWGFDEYDRSLDLAGRGVLRLCAGDSACAAHLGPDPEATAAGLLRKQADGYCSPLELEPEITRLVLGVGLHRVPWEYLPAIIYRLDRCEWHDQMAVLHMFRNVFDEIAEPSSHSQVLQRHVSMSELWGPEALTTAQLEEALGNYLMTTNVSVSFSKTVGSWPVYDPPPDGRDFAEYDGPLLMMHGTLDPSVPAERLEEMRRAFAGPVQYFVLVPDGGHVVLNESDCARDVYLNFLANPVMPPDTSCLRDIDRVTFVGDAETSEEIFGTADMWGDNVGFLQWLLFASLYRFPAVIVAVVVPAAGSIVVRRWLSRRGPQPTPRTPYLRLAIGTAAWVAIAGAMWLGGSLLPFLLPFDALYTIFVVFLFAGLQTIAGYGLLRWIVSGYASQTQSPTIASALFAG